MDQDRHALLLHFPPLVYILLHFLSTPLPLLFCFCSSPNFAFCVPHPLFSSIYRLYLLFFLVPLPTPNVFLLSSSPFQSKVVCLFPPHFLSFSSFVHVFVAHCCCCQSSNYPFALYAALCGGAMCSNGQVIRLWIVTWSLFFLSALSVLLLLLLLLKSSRVCTYISVYPHRYWLFVEEDPPRKSVGHLCLCAYDECWIRIFDHLVRGPPFTAQKSVHTRTYPPLLLPTAHLTRLTCGEDGDWLADCVKIFCRWWFWFINVTIEVIHIVSLARRFSHFSSSVDNRSKAKFCDAKSRNEVCGCITKILGLGWNTVKSE